MKILSYNPGHDGALVYIKDGELVASMEAEKNSNYRYSPVSAADVFNFLEILDEVPDVVCTGGWWPRDDFSQVYDTDIHSGYLGVSQKNIVVQKRRFLGSSVQYFSSTHERSHLLCAFGMSGLPKGTPSHTSA